MFTIAISFVGLSVMLMNCAQTVEAIEMPFGTAIPLGTRNIVLDGGQYLLLERKLQEIRFLLQKKPIEAYSKHQKLSQEWLHQLISKLDSTFRSSVNLGGRGLMMSLGLMVVYLILNGEIIGSTPPWAS